MSTRADLATATAAALGALLLTACSAARPTATDTSPSVEDEPALDAEVDSAADPEEDGDGADVHGPGPLSACAEQPPLTWLSLPEASGAALLDDEGARAVVVADSGNHGQAVILDLSSGAETATTLPVDDGVGDDVEGLARAPDGRIVGLTSAGWFREWRVEGDAFVAVKTAYRGTDDSTWSCPPLGVNCAANYEGLCLDPTPPEGGCVGFAASKAQGRLVCVRSGEDGFRLDPSVTIAITDGNTDNPDLGPLSGCSYEPTEPHRLLVGGNAFTGSTLWEVVEHRTPAAAGVTELPFAGAPNQEAVLFLSAKGFASFGDLQSFETRSPRVSFLCP